MTEFLPKSSAETKIAEHFEMSRREFLIFHRALGDQATLFVLCCSVEPVSGSILFIPTDLPRKILQNVYPNCLLLNLSFLRTKRTNIHLSKNDGTNCSKSSVQNKIVQL